LDITKSAVTAAAESVLKVIVLAVKKKDTEPIDKVVMLTGA
jgi:hypothetical protein